MSRLRAVQLLASDARPGIVKALPRREQLKSKFDAMFAEAVYALLEAGHSQTAICSMLDNVDHKTLKNWLRFGSVPTWALLALCREGQAEFCHRLLTDSQPPSSRTGTGG